MAGRWPKSIRAHCPDSLIRQTHSATVGVQSFPVVVVRPQELTLLRFVGMFDHSSAFAKSLASGKRTLGVSPCVGPSRVARSIHARSCSIAHGDPRAASDSSRSPCERECRRNLRGRQPRPRLRDHLDAMRQLPHIPLVLAFWPGACPSTTASVRGPSEDRWGGSGVPCVARARPGPNEPVRRARERIWVARTRVGCSGCWASPSGQRGPGWRRVRRRPD